MQSTRGSVLALLRDAGPLPRAEIARRLGLSPATISRAVGPLEGDGIVAEDSVLAPAGAGRPATALRIQAGRRVVATVQIGIGTAHLGLFDALGRCIATAELAYRPADGPDAMLRRIADGLAALRAGHGADPPRLLGIGVAVPGPVDAAGRSMLLSINLGWRDVPVADRLESLTGLPVTVEHNVRSMALAEARFGQGRGFGSVAFVYLRTGLGAGLVVEGQPFSGGVHGAVELGHLPVIPDGLRCVCGGRGCIETVVSEAALRATTERLGLGAESSGPAGQPNRLAVLWAAAQGGDREAARAVDAIVGALATGLGALITLLNPAILLLGGALAAIPDGLFERIRTAAHDAAFPVIRDSIRLAPSGMGLDAGLAGGATVALERFFYD